LRNDEVVEEDLIAKCHIAVKEYCNELVPRMINNNFYTIATESNSLQKRWHSKLQNRRIISHMFDVEGNKMLVFHSKVKLIKLKI
jgi:hypothetical protein